MALEFYNTMKDSLPDLPAAVNLSHILVSIKASKEAQAKALARIEEDPAIPELPPWVTRELRGSLTCGVPPRMHQLTHPITACWRPVPAGVAGSCPGRWGSEGRWAAREAQVGLVQSTRGRSSWPGCFPLTSCGVTCAVRGGGGSRRSPRRRSSPGSSSTSGSRALCRRRHRRGRRRSWSSPTEGGGCSSRAKGRGGEEV